MFDAFWGPGPPACAMASQLCEILFFTCFDLQICVFRVAWGTIGSYFWGPEASLGDYFQGLGVPLDGSGAQSLPKTVSLFHARSLFNDFGSKMGARKVPKWSQNLKKDGPKLDQKINAVLDRFCNGF